MMSNRGFTLIELMISIVIGGLITAATYATYVSQHHSYYAQDQVAEMQQNLRAALSLLTTEIRMAGYDPQDADLFGITSALSGRLQFTTDMDADGILDLNETIDLGFSPGVDAGGNGIPDADANGDGVPDPVDIGIQNYSNTGNPGGYQSMGENIQAIEFLYLNAAGAVTGVLNNVASIQITILARAARADARYMNTTVYVTDSGQVWGPYNDNFRRRMLTTRVRCRNMGI